MPKPPSGYVPLDMNYLRNEKIRRAGPDAELLFLRSLAHSKSSRTNGFVADYDLEVVGIGLGVRTLERRVEQLVRYGLWAETRGGWTIPSWLQWNSSEEELEAARQKKSAAAVLTNHKRYHQAEADPECAHCQAGNVTPLRRSGAQ